MKRNMREKIKCYYLEVLEGLPLDGEREEPDDEGPDGVQDHAGGGRHLLSHTHAGEVEEGDAGDVY